MERSDKTPKPVPLNPSYTIRVLSCVFFICLTEILLAHYVYRLIYSEMKSDFISRQEFQQVFINELRNSEAIIRKMHQVIPERRKRAVDTILPQTAEPYVEFISPENNTARGTTENDSWFYLSSYSRIPKKTLDGYCKKMSTLCPPPPTRAGPIGPPGVPGLKGDRGDTGLPGVPGAQGPRGLSGVPGVTGMKGEQGRPGLDGRDGIPGEPGLDGMPGRNGHDGKDGTDGPPGIPGRDAKDGKDGIPGLLGPQGPPGPQGSRGLTGPRGRPGKHGNHGTPGAPGITTWTTKTKLPLNVSQLLIPPSIAEYSPRTSSIMVEEGDHARILCSATGSPKPKITWQRLDNRPINRGAWQDVGIAGETLNITRVNRIHMGIYVCIADNGIPPQANKTFNLEVLFPPLIRIKNQMVGVTNGSTATLECETEAYPEPIRYWKRSDGLLIENGTKYQILNIVDRDIFRTRMQLNIFRINHHDLDKFYYCVSKNELQTTTGEITLFEGTPMFGGNNEDRATIYGMLPPDKVSLEDLCGPPVECPECATKCNASGVSLNDLIDGKWDVRPYGLQKYQKYPPRITNCVLYAVGKPVYHRYTDDVYGSWMRDPQPPRPDDEDKYFVTKKKHKNILYEYANKTMFRKDKAIQHDLGKAPFQGNSHLVYKNYFYYNEENTTRIVKFGLGNGKISTLELPLNYNKTVALYNDHYNLVDFSLDDNGLWVIFGVPDSNKTAVMKIDDEKFQIQYIWNISVNHHKVGEMFIVCGVLYAIDSVTDKNTIIRFAFDLYTGKLLDVADLSLSFTNPFGKTTMITYNDRSKELYTWDKGNQLTYPVRYRELGFNSTAPAPPTPD